MSIPEPSALNAEVLQADFTPMLGMGPMMADQSAGMLLQDVESFSQGYMQIMTAAIGKATAELVATDGAKGKTALEDLSAAMTTLPVFVTAMAGAAAAMEAMTPSSTQAPQPSPPSAGLFARRQVRHDS